MEIEKEIKERLRAFKDSRCKKERKLSHALLLLNKGKSIAEVAEIFDVTQRAVYNWIKNFKMNGISSISRKVGAGRKAILNEEQDKKVIQEQIKLYPNQPKKAYGMTLEKLSKEMSYKTFKRFLKKHSI
jgi:transposase